MRLVALAMLGLMVAGAITMITRSPYSYSNQDREYISSSSSSQHWLGTDELGRDRAVRTAGAVLLGLGGACGAAAIAAALAVSAGVVAAFSSRRISHGLIYICDLALTLPWIFLLMIVRSALPLSLSPVHSALVTFSLLAILGAPVFVRLNYTRAVLLRRAGWLLHGRAFGISLPRLARIHLIPHLKPLFLTQFLTYIPVCLIAEANLGALGLGVSQPLPSWGSMLLELQNSVLLSGSRLVYLPLCLMVLIIFLLEMFLFEVES